MKRSLLIIMNVGTEWLVDAEGCSAARLCDIETIRGVCNEVMAELELSLVAEPMWHKFPHPGGVTGLYLLKESHLACHTYPEMGIATFNLYCCRPRPSFSWEARLAQLLGATRVSIRTVERGCESADRDSFESKFSELTSAREVGNQ